MFGHLAEALTLGCKAVSAPIVRRIFLLLRLFTFIRRLGLNIRSKGRTLALYVSATLVCTTGTSAKCLSAADVLIINLLFFIADYLIKVATVCVNKLYHIVVPETLRIEEHLVLLTFWVFLVEHMEKLVNCDRTYSESLPEKH